MRDQLEPIWDRIRTELRRDVADFKFHIWLDPLELAGVEGETLFVRAPDHIRTWVRDRYLPLVRTAASRGYSPNAVVQIVDEQWQPPESSIAPIEQQAPDNNLNPKYTFEQFVIGKGSRFAHAAALSVAEMPGQAYNPLFIHGRPGLGKTHLLHAIGNYVQRYGSGLTVRYATVEQFTNEFVDAVRAREGAGFAALPEAAHATRRRSRSASAASTSCYSTTSSSLPTRPAPRRSCSTRSTSCTTPAASS